MNLLEKVQSICTAEDAVFVNEHCNWSVAKNWAQWWTWFTHQKKKEEGGSLGQAGPIH